MEQHRKTREVLNGYPAKMGAVKRGRGYNFTLETKEKEVSLLLYKKGAKEPEEEIQIPALARCGQTVSVYLPELNGRKYEYNYKIEDKIVQDPCAAVLCGEEAFGLKSDTEDVHKVRCGFLTDETGFSWEEDRPLQHAYKDTIIYKVHVRGYTKNKYSKVRKKGTFAGLQEKIPYFKELGITALELMPAYDFQEVVQVKDTPKEFMLKRKEDSHLNYWGYKEGFYFAPKSAYCATKNPVTEVKQLVKALHQEGIECLMEFYFPKTVAPSMVLEVLRHWVLEYHIDGFHVIGDGVPCELLLKDPLLRNTKLIMNGMDDSWFSERKEDEFKNAAVSREDFKQNMRRFLKSDEGSLNGALYHMHHQPEQYAVINYICNQDGFTLADLVSYDRKHNEANGEDNKDGNPYNYSWNCGVEGPSRKQTVKDLRKKQVYNAFLLMLLSQGVPMIYGGDEFGNSQEGNNNAYCQDNEIGWVDWSQYKRQEELTQFVKALIAFRKDHRILHMEKALRHMDHRSLGFPDLSYHSDRAWVTDFDHICRHAGVMYCGEYAVNRDGKPDDMIYVAYNFHWEPQEFALPNLADKKRWKLVIDSGEKTHPIAESQKSESLEDQKSIVVGPRTIQVLLGE